MNVGICTALPKEYAAVKSLLENPSDYVVEGVGAGRRYLLGEIPSINDGKHSVVLTLADMGNNMAAMRTTLLLEHFPNVRSIIMTGIAGGVPNPEKPAEHVRLGDIVVSNQGGVIQYDFVKETRPRKSARVIFTPRHPPRPPSAELLQAVRLLEAGDLQEQRPWMKFIERGMHVLKVERPTEETDLLGSPNNPTNYIPHPPDPKRVKNQPRVFIGPIASANTLLKDPVRRDALRDQFGVKAVEMEGSGISDATWIHESGYLVVRGICDYCDINKTDDWQMYAAVVAAAYTVALIESLPVADFYDNQSRGTRSESVPSSITIIGPVADKMHVGEIHYHK